MIGEFEWKFSFCGKKKKYQPSNILGMGTFEKNLCKIIKVKSSWQVYEKRMFVKLVRNSITILTPEGPNYPSIFI